MRPESMVVLESGSHWPAWLGARTDAARHVAVVTQRPSETPAAFQQRASDRIGVQASRQAPLTATLVCNRRQGREAQALRRSLTLALIEMLRQAGSGHVVLAGSDAERLKSELGDLAGHDWLVSVRFRALDPVEQVTTAVRRVA